MNQIQICVWWVRECGRSIRLFTISGRKTTPTSFRPILSSFQLVPISHPNFHNPSPSYSYNVVSIALIISSILLNRSLIYFAVIQTAPFPLTLHLHIHIHKTNNGGTTTTTDFQDPPYHFGATRHKTAKGAMQFYNQDFGAERIFAEDNRASVTQAHVMGRRGYLRLGNPRSHVMLEVWDTIWAVQE